MLAIHWSPVKNTKHIIKRGISKSKNGVYCFPLTGHREVDNWWVKAFNQYNFRKNKKNITDLFLELKKNFYQYILDIGLGQHHMINLKKK